MLTQRVELGCVGKYRNDGARDVIISTCTTSSDQGVGHNHVRVSFADSAVAFPYILPLRFQLPSWAIQGSRTRFFGVEGSGRTNSTAI